MVEPTGDGLKHKARALDQKKARAERRMAEIAQELQTMDGSPGLVGNLVDKEGFPRADVDVYRARTLRQEHICLCNDHKACITELHATITALHQGAQRAGTATIGERSTAQSAAPPTASSPPDVPFAVINRVDGGSPAEAAGLREGDQLLQVGQVTGGAGGVHAVASQLAAWKGRAQLVHLLRDGRAISLHLTPASWQGRGLLGCVMAPL